MRTEIEIADIQLGRLEAEYNMTRETLWRIRAQRDALQAERDALREALERYLTLTANTMHLQDNQREYRAHVVALLAGKVAP